MCGRGRWVRHYFTLPTFLKLKLPSYWIMKCYLSWCIRVIFDLISSEFRVIWWICHTFFHMASTALGNSLISFRSDVAMWYDIQSKNVKAVVLINLLEGSYFSVMCTSLGMCLTVLVQSEGAGWHRPQHAGKCCNATSFRAETLYCGLK